MPCRSVITPKRRRCKHTTVAHSSLLLPDVSPEANVPPAVATTIIEYARAMPTWEVCARAGVEVAVSVLVAFFVVKAIQKATDRAIHVSSSLTPLGHLAQCLACTGLLTRVFLLTHHRGNQLNRTACLLFQDLSVSAGTSSCIVTGKEHHCPKQHLPVSPCSATKPGGSFASILGCHAFPASPCLGRRGAADSWWTPRSDPFTGTE